MSYENLCLINAIISYLFKTHLSNVDLDNNNDDDNDRSN